MLENTKHDDDIVVVGDEKKGNEASRRFTE